MYIDFFISVFFPFKEGKCFILYGKERLLSSISLNFSKLMKNESY